MKPLVSVVMPVRNGGEFLGEAVASILSQTCHRLELLLVDDHSTDDSLDALDKTDPRLRIFTSRGHGVVSAFNTGMTHCGGDYIARMDADDISLPERLACQLEYLAHHPRVDIAGCCVEIFSSTGVRGGLQRYQAWLNSVLEPDDIHRQIFVESPMPNPGLMFRRPVLQKLGAYRDVQWAEDYDLILRADAAGVRMGKPRPVLLRWREHEARITHNDPRYDQRQFMRAKVHFIVHHRIRGQAVIIWGAGPTGRSLHDLLIAEGAEVTGFLEVHPRRIGGLKRGLPVWAVDKVPEAGLAMILVAVGAAGARAEIGAFMRDRQKIEGRDYLFVA